jgi:hypothetical protein
MPASGAEYIRGTLWRRGPSFAEIALDEPFARVLIRKNGALNLEDLTKPLESEAPAPRPADSKPMRLFIDRFTAAARRASGEPRRRASSAAPRRRAAEGSQRQPAIAELETATRARLEVPKADLEALGKLRSEAIQAALLGSGDVDPARAFVITSDPKPGQGNAVRVEMSLK